MPRERRSDKLPLLDTPDAWLELLVSGQYLDRNSKINVCKTCRQLFRLRTKALTLPLLNTGLYDAVQTLKQAVGRSRIRLRLRPGIDMEDDSDSDDETSWEQKLMSDTVHSFLKAAGQMATRYVTTLQLQGAWLDSVLSLAIVQACPALTQLELIQCTIHWSNTATGGSPGSLQRLKSIQLRQLEFEGDLNRQQLQAELGAQPALNSLRAIRSYTLEEDRHPYEDVTEMVNVLAGQLTHLCLDVEGPDEVGSAWPKVAWAKLGTKLQHLQLPGLEVYNDYMKVFLAWPALTSLEANFMLTESFVAQPCKWQEVTCDWMHVLSLARLPLHSGLLMKIGTSSKQGTLDLQQSSGDIVQQAIHNLSKCKGIVWSKRGVHVHADEDADLSLSRQLLVQVLSLVRSTKILTVDNVHFDWGSIQALCDFVRSREDKPQIVLKSSCVWEAGHVVCLVANMPEHSCLELFLQGGDSEAVVTQLCCAAQRKLTLRVHCVPPMQDGCMQRIRTSMLSCGHEHVELLVR